MRTAARKVTVCGVEMTCTTNKSHGRATYKA
jgi:hypothetical protein